jgi:hypothetical protein
MTGKQIPGQIGLRGLRGKSGTTQGTIERNAARDLRELEKLDAIPPGMEAIKSAIRQVARQLDAAAREDDRYSVITASSQLLKLRLALTPGAIHEHDDGIERLIAALPATPRWYREVTGPA